MRSFYCALGLVFATAALQSAPASLKMVVPAGYLPNVPVLVRVEAIDSAAQRDFSLWETQAVLSASGISLSTNRVALHNGLGTALVAFNGGGDFDLTATLGALTVTKTLHTMTNLPVVSTGGILPGSSTVWSGVILITNDVAVPIGHTLTIESNTIVMLNGVASATTANDIFVNGTFLSLGTEDFPVTITCASPTLRWGQIRYTNAQPSILRFTSITRAGRAPGEQHTGTGPVLRPLNTKVTLDNCNITDHADGTRGVVGFGLPGKAMYAINSTLIFTDCVLARCRMGPEIQGTSLACTNTDFVEMFGPDDADGIYLHSGPAMYLDKCVFAYGDDDGIDTLDSVVHVSNSIIRDWSNLLEDAKGISVFSGATHIRRCLFTDCTVSVAAKTTGGSSVFVTINESTITGISNSVLAAFKSNATGPVIDYRITNCIMRCQDAVKSDFGPTNFTIRYCNISETWPGTGNGTNDPLFVNAAAHDFHLQPYSPSIDAGNPASPLDPDGSPIDQGIHTFLPPAPLLSDTLMLSNSAAQFTLNGYSNRNYIVEFSTNLPVWSILRTNFQSAESTMVQDDSAGDSPLRFYRAHLAP